MWYILTNVTTFTVIPNHIYLCAPKRIHTHVKILGEISGNREIWQIIIALFNSEIRCLKSFVPLLRSEPHYTHIYTTHTHIYFLRNENSLKYTATMLPTRKKNVLTHVHRRVTESAQHSSAGRENTFLQFLRMPNVFRHSLLRHSDVIAVTLTRIPLRNGDIVNCRTPLRIR